MIISVTALLYNLVFDACEVSQIYSCFEFMLFYYTDTIHLTGQSWMKNSLKQLHRAAFKSGKIKTSFKRSKRQTSIEKYLKNVFRNLFECRWKTSLKGLWKTSLAAFDDLSPKFVVVDDVVGYALAQPTIEHSTKLFLFINLPLSLFLSPSSSLLLHHTQFLSVFLYVSVSPYFSLKSFSVNI